MVVRDVYCAGCLVGCAGCLVGKKSLAIIIMILAKHLHCILLKVRVGAWFWVGKSNSWDIFVYNSVKISWGWLDRSLNPW